MRRLIPVVALVALALPATAHAGWFPAEALDGPSADIVSVADADVAREGAGAVAYLKREGGLEHVFVSRLANGAWEAPVRVDQGIVPAASQAVIAAANPDRVAVAWISGAGTLLTSVRPAGAPGFTPPRVVADGGVSDPSIDISINGVTYVSFTHNGDVRAARAPRDSADFTVLPSPLDFEPARSAGTGQQRSRIAVSADGSAVVVWGEDGSDGRSHVFGRRIFEQRLSSVVEDLTLASFEGVPAGGADRPEISIEDDSSFAQVAFRQQTAGGPRVIGRRLVGSQFETPFAIDGGQAAGQGRIALTGRGEGVTVAGTTTNQVVGGVIWNNKIERVQRVDSGPGGIAPRPIPLVGENEDGAWSWFAGASPLDATVRGRLFSDIQTPALAPEVTLSNPAFGAADPSAGLVGGSTRVSDHVIAFVQGTGTERRVVAAVNDDPPSRPLGQNTTGLRRLERFKWAPARDLWGQTLYRVFLGGKPIAETTATELRVRPGMVRDGTHKWYVIAVDRRGQTTQGPPRTIRIDNTPPHLRASIGRRGRNVGIRVTRFADRGIKASGVSRLVVNFGNGRRMRIGRSARYTYPRPGSYRLRVIGRDKAGNRSVIKRTMNVR